MSPFKEKKTYVDDLISKTVRELHDLEIDSEEYASFLDRLGKLQKIRQDEKPNLPSPDTILTVGANLVGIFMIIHHERVNVITSKALSFVLKPR
jgi:hypothetical protein